MYLYNHTQYFYGILISFGLTCFLQENYILNLDKIFSTNVDTRIVANYTCFSKSYNRTIQLLTITINFLDGVVLNNMYTHIEVFYKYNTFKPFLVNVTDDFCGLLSGRSQPKVLSMVYTMLKKHSNVNHPCPYTVRE